MEHEFRRVYAHAALVLASGGKNNFVATKTITPTRYESVGCDEENFSSPEESLPASGVIFFSNTNRTNLTNLCVRRSGNHSWKFMDNSWQLVLNINYQKLLVNDQK